jgi:choline dehydrogenase-like flavoprotein
MFITFEQLSFEEDYDVCVIGSGPAGCIIALEYARLCKHRRVLLLEYGDRVTTTERNNLDDSIHVSDLRNHHAPYECTNKGLGGSSATWGGRCVMYDRADFRVRGVIGEHCTWSPAFLDACEPYVQAAQYYFESGQGPFDLKSLSSSTSPLAAGFASSSVSDTVLERWSMPTRFGVRYAADLELLPNLHFLAGAEARSFSSPSATGAIAWTEIRAVGSAKIMLIRSQAVVISTGAQEATRLLLRNRQVFDRLVKVPPALGLYYQGHISGKIASICFTAEPETTEFGFRRESDGTYQRRRFQFTESALVQENLLNTAFWLDNPLYFDPSHNSGPMSFMYLAMVTPILGKKLAPPTIAHSITKGKINKVGAHLCNIVRGLPGSLLVPAGIFVQRYLKKRKLPGVFLYSAVNRYALHFHAEQIPDQSNRMELAPDGEGLVIHYRVTEADANGVVRAHEVLDRELRACGAGELEYWYPSQNLVAAVQEMSKDGVHQSGTTRISDSPDQGVLDADLRVWGTTNLYVCSSSAFPTSGQANPTFFLGVCAVRLARMLANSHA